MEKDFVNIDLTGGLVFQPAKSSESRMHVNRAVSQKFIEKEIKLKEKLEKQFKDNQEEKSMLKNFNANKMFGKIGNVDDVKYTFTGGLAVPNGEGGYVSFDKETKTLTDNMDMVMDFGFAFAMPVPRTQVQIGDVVLSKNGKYAFVDTVEPLRIISASGVVSTVKDIQNILFNVNMVTVVRGVEMGLGNQNGAFNPMMLMMMSGNNEEGESSMSKMMEMMMLSSMFSGQNNSNMFGFNQAQQKPVVETQPGLEEKVDTLGKVVEALVGTVNKLTEKMDKQ